MDALASARAGASLAGGAAPSIARRAPAGPLAASWPVRCRAAASAAAASPSSSHPHCRAVDRLRAAAAGAAAPARPSTSSSAAATEAAAKPARPLSSMTDLVPALLSRYRLPAQGLALASAVTAASLLLLAPAALASEGGVALSGAGLELFEAFLDQVTALGIWGPVLFCATVMICEMIPLFPTQPLALSSGLLFGAKWGAAYQLLAVTLAAGNAFLVARTVGRSLAERVIREELGPSAAASMSSTLGSADGEEETEEGQRAAAAAAAASAADSPPPSGLARATRAIEEGGPFKQFTAVLLLRLTPVVPFSASNYLLGLTPLKTLPYLTGTVVGMLPWTVLYAGVGGASRRLLQRGVSVELLMQDLSERAARVSGDAAGAVAALLAAAAAAYALSQALGSGRAKQQEEQQQQGAAAAAGAAESSSGGVAAAGGSRKPASASAAAEAAAAAAAAGGDGNRR